MERIQSHYIFDSEINAGKMIFLSGPRQVGKTTFVKNRLRELNDEELYFNWDDPYVKRMYVKNPHFLKPYIAGAKSIPPLIVFDEIHKHKNWKNILKGLYDIHSEDAQIIVTGSARLDFFRQSGDSLVGRYFSYKLLPLGLAEAVQDFSNTINNVNIIIHPDKNGLLQRLQTVDQKIHKEAFERWMLFGGFPEPFLKGKPSFSIRWQKDYKSLLITEDLRELTKISDIKGIEQLMLVLPERIASPLSINSLREDLLVNHKTVQNWLYAFKKLYLVFSLMPWSHNISRAIKKEEKYYFFDWTWAGSPGAQFENAVAVSLLRLVCRWNEVGSGDFELRYIRNQMGYEIDFVLIKDGIPVCLIEAKKSDAKISKSGRYFSNLLNIPYYQIVADYDFAEAYSGTRYIVPAWRFLPLLG